MTKKRKSNILQFPIERTHDAIGEKIIEEMHIHEECADLGRFCVEVLQKTLRRSDISEFANMNFNDIDSLEYRDMFVILNLLVSMFLRKAKIDHLLQEDLTNIYNKLYAIDIAAKHHFDFDEEEDDDFT